MTVSSMMPRGRALIAGGLIVAAALMVALLLADACWAKSLGEIGDSANAQTSRFFTQIYYVVTMAGVIGIAVFKRWGALVVYMGCMAVVGAMILRNEKMMNNLLDIVVGILT